MEEKLLPPALCLEGKDEFSRDGQHGVSGRVNLEFGFN